MGYQLTAELARGYADACDSLGDPEDAARYRRIAAEIEQREREAEARAQQRRDQPAP